MSLVCLYQENIKESEKMMEIVNEENLLNDLSNFNKTFRKDVT